MKAISLWQPWATLIMLGEKRIETRSWLPPRDLFGQRVAIHASQTLDPCINTWPFSKVIPDEITPLPRGAVLGSVILHSAWEIGRLRSEDELLLANGAEHERDFGDYTRGRFAWLLRDVQVLAEPVPLRGRQRIFNIPDDLLNYTAPQGSLL